MHFSFRKLQKAQRILINIPNQEWENLKDSLINFNNAIEVFKRAVAYKLFLEKINCYKKMNCPICGENLRVLNYTSESDIFCSENRTHWKIRIYFEDFLHELTGEK